MKLSNFLPRLLRGSLTPPPDRGGASDGSQPSLFAPTSPVRSGEIRLSPGSEGLRASTGPRGVRRGNRSWFGWLFGRNRRRDGGGRLVQGELLLTQVRPVRNDFRDADSGPVRSRAKVLYETPPAPERRDDQDHAWNRLRNRRADSLVVSGE